MLTCEQVRLRVGGDPEADEQDLELHVADCADCAQFRVEMRTLNRQIRTVLRGPALEPSALAVRTPTIAGSPRRWRVRPLRRYALAASAAFACLLLGALLVFRTGDALARDLVAHVAEEPDSWSQNRPVPQSALDLVLRKSGVRLDRRAAGEVVYVHSCWFRGRYVPHLVVSTADGPVTVIVLPGERITTRSLFREAGYTGVLEPAAADGVGFAVLGRIDGAALNDVAAKLRPILVDPAAVR